MRIEDTASLGGRVVGITRPEKQAREIAELVSRMGGVPYIVPMVEIRPSVGDQRLNEFIDRVLQGRFDYLIFLSVNSVQSLFEVIEGAGLGGPFLKRAKEIQVIAIGPKTGRELELHGIRSIVVPRRYSTEGILEGLDEVELRGRVIGIPRSSQADESLRRELERRGAEVQEFVAYESNPPSEVSRALKFLDDLSEGGIDIVTFTSASTVLNIFRIAEEHASVEKLREGLNRTTVAAIGPMTGRALEALGVQVDVTPEKYTVEGMMEAVAKHVSSELNLRD